MAPMFLFLASSFNVELVYVILKGITQFSYLIQSKTQRNSVRAEGKKSGMELVYEDGNVTVVLNQIKIKDFDKWSRMKTDEEVQQLTKENLKDLQKSQESSHDANVLKMNERVTITYHKMDLFMEMFPE
jgi:hypothetical protein